MSNQHIGFPFTHLGVLPTFEAIRTTTTRGSTKGISVFGSALVPNLLSMKSASTEHSITPRFLLLNHKMKS